MSLGVDADPDAFEIASAYTVPKVLVPLSEPGAVKSRVKEGVVNAVFLRASTVGKRNHVEDIIADAHIVAAEGSNNRLIRVPVAPGVQVGDVVVGALGILSSVGSIAVYAAVASKDDWGLSQRAKIFSTHVVSSGIGALGWGRLARTIPIPMLISAAGFSQLTLLGVLVIAVTNAPFYAALPLVCLHGFATGAQEVVFLALNYFDHWEAHTRTMIWRAVLVAPAQTFLEFGFAAFVMRHSSRQGTTSERRTSIAAAFGIVALVVACLASACRYLPIRSNIRLPKSIRFADMAQHSVYLAVVAAETIEALCAYVLQVIPLEWFLRAGFDATSEIPSLLVAAGGITAAALTAFCVFAGTVEVPLFVIAVTAQCLLAPLLLGLIALWSSDTLRPCRVQIIFIIAVALQAVKKLSRAMVKVRALPSRWRYITFQAYSSPLVRTAEAASPFLAWAIADAVGLHMRDAESDILARSSLVYALPFTLIQFVVQLLAVFPMRREHFLPSSLFRELQHTPASK